MKTFMPLPSLLCRRRRLEGELNVECAAFPFATANPDHAAMQVHYQLAEREAEAGAAHARCCSRCDLSEFAEDHFVILHGNSRAVVRHREEDRVAFMARTKSQLDRIR